MAYPERRLSRRSDCRRGSERSEQMPRQDLRDLVVELIQRGDLIEISQPVSVTHELASVAYAVEEQKGAATFFRKLDGYPGVSVLSGVASTYERVAFALGVDLSRLKERLMEALANPVPPSQDDEDVLERTTASGADVDLMLIPIPTHAPKDAGPYVTAGIVAARDPETGRMNYSYHRMLRLDATHLSIMINPGRHLDDYRQAAAQAGTTLPVAVFIGVHPAVMLGAAMRYPGDELEIAGSLLGEPIQTILCLDSDLAVPAFSEYILEGVIDPSQRVDEGPMGEFTGLYGIESRECLLEISTIRQRADPIYQTILPAGQEHKVLGATLPREPLLLSAARQVSPQVKDVYIPPYGSGFLAVVVFDPGYEGEAKNVGLAALSAYTTIKTVIVVNSDIDTYDPREVIWALVTRADFKDDLAILPWFLGHPLDPSAEHGLVTKSVIDATLLPGSPAFERVIYDHPDGLDKYLPDQD
jgi:2,5-furandicarboxylate decarboxylase 1